MGAIINQNEIVGAIVNGKIVYEAPGVALLSSLIFGADSGQKDITSNCGLISSDGSIIDAQYSKSLIISGTSGYIGKSITLNKLWNLLLTNHLTDFYLAWDGNFLKTSDYDLNGNFITNHNAYIHHDTITESQLETGLNNIGFFNISGKSFFSGNNGVYSSPQSGKLLFNVAGTKQVSVASGENIVEAFNSRE